MILCFNGAFELLLPALAATAAAACLHIKEIGTFNCLNSPCSTTNYSK